MATTYTLRIVVEDEAGGLVNRPSPMYFRDRDAALDASEAAWDSILELLTARAAHDSHRG